MRHVRLLSLLAFAAAGCSGSGLSSNDLGVGSDGGADFATPGPDMAMTPAINTGTKLVGGTVDFFWGVTSDDYVVYQQTAQLSAVSAAGGAVKSIDANSQFAQVSGSVVLSLSNADAVSNQVTLTAWTSAGGAKTISTNTALTAAVVSSDNAKVAYTDNASPDGEFADVYLANIDGTGAVKLLTHVTTTTDLGGCAPQIAFTATRVLVAHCPDPGDAGASTATLSSYLIAGGGAVDIAANLQSNASGTFFSVSKTGEKVIYFDNSTNVFGASTDGTNVVSVEAAGAFDGYLLNDASAAIYVSAANELKRAVLGSAATQLGPTTVTGFAVNFSGPFRSGDDKYVVWYNVPDPNGAQGVSDLYLSGTATNGTAITLADQPNGFIYGDAFTTDNSRVLYFTDVDTNANLSGTLKSQSVPTGTATTHATAVWEVHAGAGTVIAYNDNYTETTTGTGQNMTMLQRGDVRVVDSAANGAPKLVATQADVGFLMSHAKDKVIYLWNQKAGSEGIYAAPATP